MPSVLAQGDVQVDEAAAESKHQRHSPQLLSLFHIVLIDGQRAVVTRNIGVDIGGSGDAGAGRAICSSLADHGAKKIYVTDLYPSSSSALVENIYQNFAPTAQMVKYGDYSPIQDCHMVINASFQEVQKYLPAPTTTPCAFSRKRRVSFSAQFPHFMLLFLWYNNTNSKFFLQTTELRLCLPKSTAM